MTSTSEEQPQSDPGTPAGGGIRAAAARTVAHARSLARLQQELTRAELQRKGQALGAGAAVGIAAAIFALFAVGFGLATIAAAFALVVPWWLALLIVFVLLVLLVVALGLTARSLFRKGTPLKPTQALEEARLTKQALKGGGGHGE